MKTEYFRVLFSPSSRITEVTTGTTILTAARKAGVYTDSQCNGKGTCGKCKVRVLKGGVSSVVDREHEFINQSERELGYRLACLTHILRDTAIFVPGENILTPAASRKVFAGRSTRVSPAVKIYSTEITVPGNSNCTLAEQITSLMAGQHGLKITKIDDALFARFEKLKNDDGRKALMLVWMDIEIIDILLEENPRLLGLALDIGTTTVALYICDLNNGAVLASGSFTNPQVLFGTDIMSRISYSVDNPGTGVKRMREELVTAVNRFINEISAQEGFSIENIVDASVVGNTVMHHIFLGIAPDHLGLWPFKPAISDSTNMKAKEIGLKINPAAYVHALPVEAGFVGADNVAVLISEEPYRSDRLSLIIDLGTNGELILGNKKHLMSCSCATGPAFEGAQISSGMRATSGAIEKIRIDPESFSVDFVVIGTDGWASQHPPGALKPVGICGSAILDAVAHLFKAGIIEKSGAFAKKRKITGLRKGESGIMEFLFVAAPKTGTGRDIVLTQKDIRQIQLAKAAVQAGCRVLMRHFNLDSIHHIIIAGAFGLHIDKEHALEIGLIPHCSPENILMVGNAAGHGAYLALIDRDKRTEADIVARKVEHIELALESDFQQEFMKCLPIPYE